ncbi:atrial natriuretic peptide receptor 1-like [Mytilus edulis]|uniref:atrial natriuretic peptide receptor 1-like n=1 Tax=Mytilus edulis TaxID=6550 RepID=UPI0039EF7C73
MFDVRIFCWIILTCLISNTSGYHSFGNAQYHCWPLAADANSPTPLTSCSGVNMRWVVPPPSEIEAETEFNVTYELILDTTFYTWAFTNGYFDNSGPSAAGFSDDTTAQAWCENTICPAATSADETNCCVHHVNAHSCPLAGLPNALCGPWIPPTGSVFTHSSVLVGPVQQGNWSSHIGGLYEEGLTALIAHFKVAGLHLALEIETRVLSKTDCGDGTCATGEDCETCPKDCGSCPLKSWAIALIVTFLVLAVTAACIVFGYFRYQQRKLLWDESWIAKHDDIKEDDGLRGAFGSMISVNCTSNNDMSGTNSMAMSATRKQVFAKTAIYKGRTVCVRKIKKKEFSLTSKIRKEVKATRELDQLNLCKFVAGCIDVPNVCILTEYCPKGSISDVLMNDEVPLNWAFRFSFASDIARGMNHLHDHKIIHGRLKSNNCVVDDRWTVKVTDYGLTEYRTKDKMMIDLDDDDDDNDDDYYKEMRTHVYRAPELSGQSPYIPTEAGDVYAFAIILVEIATRNDPYGDEDVNDLPVNWKPPVPDLDPEYGDKDNTCPCPDDYINLLNQCWDTVIINRPDFDTIKKTIHRINPHKMSPVDLMMAMMEKYSKHLESIVAERTQDLVHEKQKTDRLLYSMLPRSIADDLKIGKSIEAEWFDSCTIYFSDIVGFTTISGGSTPIQVVQLLNQLYITFDDIIDKYDVYKVETIGDAYMVVSGIPTRTCLHAREISNMSLEIVAACKVFVIPHRPSEPLKIRVGLHSGPACAGVVGLKMPRYCLFGDTVNTASRMESNGEAYRIHMSNFTYEELEHMGGFDCESRGTIPVKGKGDMKTWWLLGHTNDYNKIHESLVNPIIPQGRLTPIDSSRADVSEADIPESDKSRKISNISTSNDSGYNEKNDDVLPDIDM